MKQETRVDGPWEFGTKPVQRNNATDWAEQREFAKRGELDKIDPKIYITHYTNLRAIAKDHQQLEERKEPKTCYWFVGKPGSGKTK